MSPTRRLKVRLAQPEPLFAPLVLNPLMAKQADAAGFEAMYLGGGAMGYAKVELEANLSLTEMVHAGVEINAVTERPLILDGAAGWGDPMHMRRTISMAESAGFAGIEIEDQLLPKRAHHHVGIEHMIPTELMAAKVRESVATRRDEDFMIIARTNAVRVTDLDDAVARLEAYKEAGADGLLALARTPETIRFIGERLPAPLVLLSPAGGLADLDMSAADLGALGFKLICDPQTVLLAMFAAAQNVYAQLAGTERGARTSGDQRWSELQHQIHDTIDIETLLRIERETVEPG